MPRERRATAAASANLLRDSLQAKAKSHETALRDEVFEAGIAAAAVGGWPAAPASGELLSLSPEPQASSNLAPRPPLAQRLRSRKQRAGALDYSRWTRRTESRVFMPILSDSASSSFEDLRLVGDEGSSSRAHALDKSTNARASTAAPESRRADAQPPATAAADGDDERRPDAQPTTTTTTTLAAAGVAAAAQRAKAPQQQQRLPPPPGAAADNDEELAEEERVELAIKAVKRLEGSLLREIQEIKERHKTLEALTITRARAAKNASDSVDAGSSRRRSRAAGGVQPPVPPPRKPFEQRAQHAPQRQPLPKQHAQPPPPLLREKTLEASPTLLVRGSLKPSDGAVLPAPGVAWTIRGLSPSAASKRPHGAWRAAAPQPPPSASARVGKRSCQQWTDLDLGSAYFLPPSVTDAKTPIEAALRLQKVLTDLSLINHARPDAALVSGKA